MTLRKFAQFRTLQQQKAPRPVQIALTFHPVHTVTADHLIISGDPPAVANGDVMGDGVPGLRGFLPGGGTGLDNLRPCVVPKLNSSWEPVYQITFPDGSSDVLSQEDIWHVRTLTLDGLVGLNPIAYAREAISLAAATEEHGARLFSNGAVTSGVLRTEQTLSDQAYERLKKDFEERHTGLGNAHRPMILEMGLDWKSMALNAEDSQFLETRKFQLEEICRLFRVPLHMVQNTDRATFNNIEELGLGFINYSLVPYLTRIEQRINTGLVRKSKQGVYYAKFNAGALLRGDMKSRFEAYATGINWGIYSPNDCRDLEDMNPRPGGDVYLTPMNMTTKPSDGSKAGKQKDNANADETTS